MTLVELLERIRQPYVAALSRAASQPAHHVEPVLRGSDGRPAADGVLDTPCRYDLIHKGSGDAQTVDATERIQLDPLRVEFDGMVLNLSAFSWDWLTVTIAGIADADANALMRHWFLRWFDADDANAANAEGLYGVVHFIDDPERVDDQLQFRIDLGSAAAESVAELIEELLRQGATAITMG